MPNPLETDPNPSRLRRVVIEPVSRVEGHGKVTLLLDDDDRVRQVRLHIVEFRGFEKFIEGRPYWEVPVLVQRLCGICPVSHHLAASKALDYALGAEQLTPSAEKLRRLMHYGQLFQSHALHFFHLASPDLLFGFDSDVAQRNIVAVAAEDPELARKGVLLRRFGQEVIRLTSGKRIHGTGSIPGGMNKNLTRAERDELLAQIDTMLDWSCEAVDLIERLFEQNAGFYEGFGAFDSHWLSLVGDDGAMELYDGGLRATSAAGEVLFDHADVQDYHRLLHEDVKSWSYMKFPFIAELGAEHGWYRVGPLARVAQCDFIPTPAAEVQRRRLLDFHAGAALRTPLGYHWARMIEMLHCAELMRELLDDDDLSGDDLLARGERRGEGVGVIEAPRGTLIHHYRIDSNDQIEMANLIVSTTHNNEAMNESVRRVALDHLDGREITEPLLNHIEVAIRAFDPCLSCATHALGRMPLEVELLSPTGEVVARRRRET